MKSRKNKRQTKKKIRGGGYIGEYDCYVSNDSGEEDSEYEKCVEEAKEKAENSKNAKIEYNRTRPARLFEKRNQDVIVDLTGVTDKETKFIQEVFEQMFLTSETDDEAIFSDFLDKLRERKVYKQFIAKKKKKDRYVNIDAGPPSPTECYNHIKAIIIDFNNRVPLPLPPDDDESLKLLEPANEFTSIFNFEFIEKCANMSLEDTRLIINKLVKAYINEFDDIPYSTDNEYSPLTTRFSHAYKNKYILFQIALAIINIVFLSDNSSDRKICNNVNDEKNRFHITLMKILLDMNPNAKISMGNDNEDLAVGGRRLTRRRRRTIKQKKSKKSKKYRKIYRK